MSAGQEHLEVATIGINPNPLKLLGALMRPNTPFVMINLLSFRERATGDYAHLTGEEAYMRYAKSVQKSQAPLGSRLVWTGEVRQKETHGLAPEFQSIAFLEYASPRAFIQFATKGGSETKARGAGLRGQWLISSTTLEEVRSYVFDRSDVVLVEMIGGLKRNCSAGELWKKILVSTSLNEGAKLIWHGSCDRHILGRADPGFEQVLSTSFPDVSALEDALKDPMREELLRSTRPYLAYSAVSSPEVMPDLR